MQVFSDLTKMIRITILSFFLVSTFGIKLLANNEKQDSIIYWSYLEKALALEKTNFDSALIIYNKMIEFSETNNIPEYTVQTIANRAYSYYYTNNFDSAFKDFDRALLLYKKANDTINIIKTYYNLGFLYGNKEFYSKAIESYTYALKFSHQLNDSLWISNVANNMGLLYLYLGLYDKSIEYAFMSMKYVASEEINLYRANLNIGLNYYKQKEFEQSLKYYHLSLKYYNGDQKKKALTYKNIGDVYQDKYDYDNAKLYYDSSFAIYKKANDSVQISTYYMLTGNISMKKMQLEKASTEFDLAIKSLPNNAPRKYLAALLYNQANLFLKQYKQGNANNETIYLAKNNAEQLLDISNKMGSLEKKTNAYELLYLISKVLKNNTDVVLFADQYIKFKDSLFSKNKQRIITETSIKYETERKELEIELLNSEKKVFEISLSESNAKRKAQRNILILSLIALFLVSILVLRIYQFYKKTQSTNKVLTQQNETIQFQNEKIELLLKEIHHRVKNNLQITSGLLQMQSIESNNKLVEKELQSAINRIQSIAAIHDILHTKGLDSEVNLNDFLVLLTNQIDQLLSGGKDIKIIIEILKNCLFSLQQVLLLGLIVNEFVTNSYKYAFPSTNNGFIKISCIKEEEELVLSIADNGIGILKDGLTEEKKGLGMRLIENLSVQLNGHVSFYSENGLQLILKFKKA